MSQQPKGRNPYTTVVIDQEPPAPAPAAPAPAAPEVAPTPPAGSRSTRLLVAAGLGSGVLALLLLFSSGLLGERASSSASLPALPALTATSAPAPTAVAAAPIAQPTAMPTAAQPTRPAPTAAAAIVAPAAAITIGTAGGDWMFDPTAIELIAGESATITFHNRAKREGHNWVLVEGDDAVVARVAAAAAQAGEAQGFLPADRASILAASPLLAAGAQADITFTAPAPGEYIFLCSVPGHFETGMHGRLTVRAAD